MQDQQPMYLTPEQQAQQAQAQAMQAQQAQAMRYNNAIGGLDQEQKDAQFNDYEGQGSAISRQMEQADTLRNAKTTQGVQAGNQFVASNPMSAVADIAKQGIGIYKGNKAEEAQKALGAKKAGAQQTMAEALFRMDNQNNKQDLGMSFGDQLA